MLGLCVSAVRENKLKGKGGSTFYFCIFEHCLIGDTTVDV